MVFQRISRRLGRHLMHNLTWKLSKYLRFPSAVCQNGRDLHSKCTQNTRLVKNSGRACAAD